MNEKNFNWLNVIKFAGAYVACAIGSGFATGQEILQFFYQLWYIQRYWGSGNNGVVCMDRRLDYGAWI